MKSTQAISTHSPWAFYLDSLCWHAASSLKYLPLVPRRASSAWTNTTKEKSTKKTSLSNTLVSNNMRRLKEMKRKLCSEALQIKLNRINSQGALATTPIKVASTWAKVNAYLQTKLKERRADKDPSFPATLEWDNLIQPLSRSGSRVQQTMRPQQTRAALTWLITKCRLTQPMELPEQDLSLRLQNTESLRAGPKTSPELSEIAAGTQPKMMKTSGLEFQREATPPQPTTSTTWLTLTKALKPKTMPKPGW